MKIGYPVRVGSALRFPDPAGAPADGLLAVGGDLSPERLRLAYASGIFPWTVRPVTWWSPDPRGIFELGSMHLSRSLRRTLRRQPYVVTRNRAFRAVIEACATVPRPGGWISREFIEAYDGLHRLGMAHSVECWQGERLVGGVYGVAVGGLFAGESMFHRADDASKVALVALHDHLISRGFVLFDIQMLTETTEALGAVEIPRAEYLQRVAAAAGMPVTFADPAEPGVG